ncbi:MAG: hypothetical protein AB7S57_14160 [Acetobacteraceae bacterium]
MRDVPHHADVNLREERPCLPLSAARGIAVGIMMSVPVWALIAALGVYLF